MFLQLKEEIPVDEFLSITELYQEINNYVEVSTESVSDAWVKIKEWVKKLLKI